MRRLQILGLTLDEVDLKNGFIRLKGNRTNTSEARSIPLHPRLLEDMNRLPRGYNTRSVFLRNGLPFDDIKHSFKSAYTRAGISDFRFHDVRHCAINALRLAVNDHFTIMAMRGHRTMSVFKRYNVVTESELKQIKWQEQI